MRLIFFINFLLSCVAGLAAPAPVPVVFTEQIVTSKLYDSLTYPARLTAKVSATILSEVEGVVSTVNTPLGGKVRVGEVIMVVKNTDPVYDYAAMKVRSPVAGIVGQSEVSEGSRVVKGQRLVTVTDPNKLRLFIEVAASDLSAIQTGLTGTVAFPGQDKIYDVRVSGVSGAVDPSTGTATAELTLIAPEKDKRLLRPGQLGKASFRVRSHDGLEVAENAIVYRGEKTFLRLIKDGKVKLAPVTLGETRRGLVEIRDGLKPGETVAVRASTYVADGETVKVESAKTEQH